MKCWNYKVDDCFSEENDYLYQRDNVSKNKQTLKEDSYVTKHWLRILNQMTTTV
jgi:hypothetical protein